jgi:hypothetical protein
MIDHFKSSQLNIRSFHWLLSSDSLSLYLSLSLSGSPCPCSNLEGVKEEVTGTPKDFPLEAMKNLVRLWPISLLFMCLLCSNPDAYFLFFSVLGMNKF